MLNKDLKEFETSNIQTTRKRRREERDLRSILKERLELLN